MTIRLLAVLVSGFLAIGANAAPPDDINERIAGLKEQNVRIKTHPRTGAVRLGGLDADRLLPS